MKIECYATHGVAKLFLEITQKFNIFLYFDYNIENVVWKLGAEFIFLDDLVSLCFSVLNVGIVFGYDRGLHIYDDCHQCDGKCSDKKDCK